MVLTSLSSSAERSPPHPPFSEACIFPPQGQQALGEAGVCLGVKPTAEHPLRPRLLSRYCLLDEQMSLAFCTLEVSLGRER